MQVPGEDDHPELHRLWRESGGARMAWRMYYRIPPNDPRALDITEDELLDDLQRIAYYTLREAAVNRPSLLIAAQRQARDAYTQAAKDAAQPDSPLQRAMAALRAKTTGSTPQRAPDASQGAPGRGKRGWWGRRG